VDELDALLDRATAERGDNGLPHEVWVFNWGTNDEFLGIRLGVGHPERSFVHFIDGSVTEFGYEPNLGYGRRLVFNQVRDSSPLSHPPGLTRVTPTIARHAAREYVTTGRRPTCLHWQPLTWLSWFTAEDLEAFDRWNDGIQH
jgi:hypothetical protein